VGSAGLPRYRAWSRPRLQTPVATGKTASVRISIGHNKRPLQQAAETCRRTEALRTKSTTFGSAAGLADMAQAE
jgi:hypothetical protein